MTQGESSVCFLMFFVDSNGLFFPRVINGVLEMDGFRMTLGFSSNSSGAECASSDGADEGTILVCCNIYKV